MAGAAGSFGGQQPEAGAPGRAATRRLTSAGLADLAARQAEALAALDRALEARLGELDRAFALRRRNLEATVVDTEVRLGVILDGAIAELKRAAGGERRLLQEAAAAELATIDAVVEAHERNLGAATPLEPSAVRALDERVARLEAALERLLPLSTEPPDQGGDARGR